MIEGQQLSAGQFAQLMKIDRHVLNRFDELGLFTPAVRDKNGRRSYDLSQINQWLSLQATVKLENDLNQTRATLKQNETDHVAMLKYQQQLIEEQLHQLGMVHQQIAQEISNQETARKAMPEAATVVNRPPVNLLTTTFPEEMVVQGEQIQQQVAHVLSAMDVAPVHLSVGKIHSRHAVEAGNDELVTALYTPLAPSSEVKADTSQLGGRAVIAYHHLDKPLMVGFNRLRKFADDHHLALDGEYYEEPIISNWQAPDPANQVVRLLVEVKE